MRSIEIPKEGLTIIETGIGGINIIQEMLKGYEGLIIIDAYQEGLEPGTLRVLEPKIKDLNLSKNEIRDYFSDTPTMQRLKKYFIF